MSSTEPISKTFKPAVARGAVTWTLHNDAVLKNGTKVADLNRVSGGNFGYTRHRGMVTRTLKIKSDGGSTTMGCGTLGETPAQRDWKEISTHTLLRIAELSPNARFHIAGGLGMILSLFFFGIVLLAGGLFVIGTVVAGETAGLLLLGVPLVGAGAWFAWNSRPWNNDRFKVPAAAAILAVVQS